MVVFGVVINIAAVLVNAFVVSYGGAVLALVAACADVL